MDEKKAIPQENNCVSSSSEEPSTPYIRVLKECSELRDKITKLNIFIKCNPQYRLLSERQQALLKQQLDVMLEYYAILEKRVLLWD